MAFVNADDTTIILNGTEIDGWVSYSLPPSNNLGSADNGGSGAPLYSTTSNQMVDMTLVVQPNTPAAPVLVQWKGTRGLIVNGSIENSNLNVSVELQLGAFVSGPDFLTAQNKADGSVENLTFVIRFNRAEGDWSSANTVAVPTT